MKLDNIWNVVKSFIAPEKQEDAKKAIENQGDTLVSEIANQVKDSVKLEIENSFKDKFKQDAPVFNVASLKSILNEATAEEKAEILSNLGYEQPKETDVAEHATVKELVTEVENLKKTVANSLGNTPKKAENNGQAPVKTEGTKQLSEAGEAAKGMYNRMLNNGSLSQTQYNDLVTKLS